MKLYRGGAEQDVAEVEQQTVETKEKGDTQETENVVSGISDETVQKGQDIQEGSSQEKVEEFTLDEASDAVPLADESAESKTLDLEKSRIYTKDTSCELAEGDYYQVKGISYELQYKDGKTVKNTVEEGSSYVYGAYDDSYVLNLVNVATGSIHGCDYEELPLGTYTLGLYTKDSKEKLLEVPDYKIVVKNISDIPTIELPLGSSKIKLTDYDDNEKVYYKYEAKAGEYYLNSSCFPTIYYYESGKRKHLLPSNEAFHLENKTYYIVFYRYDDWESDEIEFDARKEIKSIDIDAKKSSYLAYIEHSLCDWAMTITYADGKQITYVLDGSYYTVDDDAPEDSALKYYFKDGRGNKIGYSITRTSDHKKMSMDQWLTPGTYQVVIGDNAAKTITITKPKDSDWESYGQVLKVGENKLVYKNPEDLRGEYYLFKPAKDGQYIFTHSIDEEMWQDDLLCYDESEGTLKYAESGEVIYYEDHFVLNAKASKAYVFEATGMLSTAQRTLTITEKGSESHTHTYVSSVTKAPTCTENGVRTYTCKDGDDSYTEIIPATGHNSNVNIPARAATCTSSGLTDGKKCSVCGTVTVPQQTIPATGHNSNVNIPGRAATCTSNGLTDGKKCSVCGTVTVAQQVIPAYGHAMGGWVITQQPTALADGAQTRTCSRCGYAETAGVARLAATGTLNATYLPLKIKQSVTLKVNGLAAGDYVTSWKTSNAKIATVDARSGRVTGKKAGTAYITATMASGLTLKATIKVQKGTVQASSIWVNTRSVTLSKNQATQLLTSITPITAPQKASYSSSNKKVATVSGNGRIVGKKAGKATITVRVGKKSVRVYVTVVGVKTTAISVNTTQINLKVKKSATIKTSLTPKNSSEAVTYKSSNSKVATVNNKGKVYGKKAGTAVITVKSGSKSVKVNVTVKK